VNPISKFESQPKSRLKYTGQEKQFTNILFVACKTFLFDVKTGDFSDTTDTVPDGCKYKSHPFRNTYVEFLYCITKFLIYEVLAA
jgi:hypothetical protein